MAKKYLDYSGLSYLWGQLKDYFQVKLISGTNIKTINNNSLLGSGNISISGGGVTPDDYIVEQGTSGIWTYRKWNSGVAECWGTSTKSNVSMSSWGSLYYGTIAADSFPSNLFLYAPNALMFARVSGGNGWLTQTTNMTKSTTGIRYVIGVTNTTLSSVEIVTHAIGRWK